MKTGKKILMVLFFLTPFILMAAWNVYLLYTTKHASQVTVAVQGFDPRDLLSGNYILYNIDWDQTNCNQFVDNKCPYNDFKSISHRFYLPAEAAHKVDKLMRAENLESIRFDIVFSYIKGREPIALMLLINNQKWFDYFNNSERK